VKLKYQTDTATSSS